MMTQRYGFGEGSVWNAYLKQAFMPPIMPAISAPAAMFGIDVRDYGDVRVKKDPRDLGFTDSTEQNPAKRGGMLDDVMPGTMDDVIAKIGAGGLSALVQFFTGILGDTDPKNPRMDNKTYSVGEALARQGDVIGQNLADNTPLVGQLFGTFRSITPSQDASSHFVKGKMHGLDAVSDAMSATYKEGMERTQIGTKKSGIEEYLGAKPYMRPPDPQTQALSESIVQFRKELTPALSERQQAYTQRQSIQADNKITPYQKRQRLEDQALRILDINERITMDIRRVEMLLSKQYGVEMDFSKLQPGAPMLGMKPAPR
jgi:hypothetical protein